MSTRSWAAIVLAGDRRADDPLVIASGRGCKALLEIAGRPMLMRVLEALQSTDCVASVLLSGPAREAVDSALSAVPPLPSRMPRCPSFSTTT